MFDILFGWDFGNRWARILAYAFLLLLLPGSWVFLSFCDAAEKIPEFFAAAAFWSLLLSFEIEPYSIFPFVIPWKSIFRTSFLILASVATVTLLLFGLRLLVDPRPAASVMVGCGIPFRTVFFWQS